MAAYLVVSVVTGLSCAAVSYFGFGVGLLALALWYVAGCWAGFAACVAAFLLAGAGRKPPLNQWHQETAIR